MVDKNDPLLREVDEELRRERLEKLWEQYGSYALAVAALIVVLVGGWKAWEAYSLAQAQAHGAKYEEALVLAKAGKSDEADKAFSELAAGSHGGYAMLAKLNLAGALLKAGKNADALAIYEEISRVSRDSLLVEFAKLQAAALKVGDADFTEVQNRLNDLIASNGPWRPAATELLASAAFKAGKLDEATKLFTQLLGESKATADMAERANMMLSVIKATELAHAPATPAVPVAGAAPSEAPK